MSCHRGKECPFAHYTIPSKNPHLLIQSQLAKRGGHRPRTRIAPDAATGYIDPLRETNSDGDYVHPQPKRMPKVKHGAEKQDGFDDLISPELTRAWELSRAIFRIYDFPP